VEEKDSLSGAWSYARQHSPLDVYTLSSTAVTFMYVTAGNVKVVLKTKSIAKIVD
jgi:hypothetical protein